MGGGVGWGGGGGEVGRGGGGGGGGGGKGEGLLPTVRQLEGESDYEDVIHHTQVKGNEEGVYYIYSKYIYITQVYVMYKMTNP